MEIKVVAVPEAARLLGKVPSGIHKSINAGETLVLGKKPGQRVVMANGQLVRNVEELLALTLAAVDQVSAAAERTSAAEQAAQAAGDQLEVLRLEFGEFRARASSQLKALADAQVANASQLHALADAQGANARAIVELIPPP